VLAVSIDELLDNVNATEIVKNVLAGQESSSIALDLETLVDVVPILKPSQVNTFVKQSINAKQESSLSVDDMLAQLAPHLESEELKEVFLRCDNIDKNVIAEIAYHMESEDLREVLLRCDNIDKSVIAEIACYMESEDLKEVFLHCKNIDKSVIAEIACYMESEDLVEIIRAQCQKAY